MNTKKILIIIFIVLALAVAVMIYLQSKKKTTSQLTLIPGGGSSTGNPAKPPMSIVSDDYKNDGSDSNATTFPLKLGSRGKAVKMIQAAIGVSITGIWDSPTDFAVRNYFGGNVVHVQDFANAISAQGDQFPVSKGDSGEAVVDVQILVSATPDGAFGPNTEAAVLAVTGKKSINSAFEYVNLVNAVLGTNIGFTAPMPEVVDNGGYEDWGYYG